MQEIDFYLVDAFSDRAFGGNAAAVCPTEEWLPDETLLNMAQQHNQSETAFSYALTVDSSCAGSLPLTKLTCVDMPHWRHRMSFSNTLIIHTRKLLSPPVSSAS